MISSVFSISRSREKRKKRRKEKSRKKKELKKAIPAFQQGSSSFILQNIIPPNEAKKKEP